jgi:sulfonate transport system permease protein
MTMTDSTNRPNHSFPFGSKYPENRCYRVVTICALPLLMLILWYIVANALNKPYLLPTPKATFSLFLHPFTDLLSSGSLFENTMVSLLRILVGFGLAVLVAVPLGTILGGITPLRRFCDPLIELLRPISPIAWIPFAIAAFKMTTLPEFIGLGYTKTIFDHLQIGMIFVIFWGAFFPIIINTIDGVSGIRKDYIKLATMLGAKKIQLLTKVALPAASPMVLTGLRQGIGRCWAVIIAAEMLPGSDSGIGYLLIYAADQSAMDIAVASIITIGIIGASFNFMMLFASKGFIRWHGKEI